MNNSPVFFLIGYSGSGKTTLGILIKEYLTDKEIPCIQLDGNEMAEFNLSSKFDGFDINSRLARAKHLVNLVNWIKHQNLIPIVSVSGQPAEARKYWRKNISGYFEIYLKCNLDVCIKRDNKNIYNNKSNKNIIGVDIHFDEPSNPDLILDTEGNKPKDLLEMLKEILPISLEP